jgi:hypothetical protein
MQSSVNSQFTNAQDHPASVGDEPMTHLETGDSQVGDRLYWFYTQFEGVMEMYAEADAVRQYLDVHQGWFRRCAAPMQVKPLGENGYDLTIGKFGALGYYVEPKIGLELIPQRDRVYRIETIPIPDYVPPGYQVEFRATQVLDSPSIEELEQVDFPMTRVSWELDLNVGVCFPKFIHSLSPKLIQRTGDRLITQIVKQVSRRLTCKVQEDFHERLGPESLTQYRQLKKHRTSFACVPRETSDSDHKPPQE